MDRACGNGRVTERNGYLMQVGYHVPNAVKAVHRCALVVVDPYPSEVWSAPNDKASCEGTFAPMVG